MAKKNYDQLAKAIITNIGNKENVNSVIHCITRLRFYLRDESQAKTDTIKNLDGVIDVVKSGGQYQVVIGNAVGDVYDAVIHELGEGYADDVATDAAIAETAAEQGTGNRIKNGFNAFIGVITGSMSPVVGILAASGILKGLLAMFTGFHWLSATGNTFMLLNAMGDSAFYFLPIIIGYTAAKRLGGDPIITAVIGGLSNDSDRSQGRTEYYGIGRAALSFCFLYVFHFSNDSGRLDGRKINQMGEELAAQLFADDFYAIDCHFGC